MKKSEYKVSVEKCSEYDSVKVRAVLLKSLENIGFPVCNVKGKRVLIKPNLLSAAKPEAVITTHPVILEELCKILKEQDVGEIIVGDSSAFDTEKALEMCGMNKLKKYGKVINLEGEEKKFFNLGKNELSRVPLPKLVFDVDLVINFAKLKTHGLTSVTLCVKNLYGCVPGKLKEKYHRALPSIKNFSRLLDKIENKIQPELNLIDGVVGLEGEGPGASGKPFKSKVIIASKSAGAADIVASRLMGFKPKHVYTNKFSKIKEKDIEVVGTGKSVKYNFKKPSSAFIPFVAWLWFLSPKSKITFDNSKCIKCGMCGKKCPVKAITYSKDNDNFPCCDHKTCIRCLCCIEVCPEDAITLEDHWFKKAVKAIVKKFRKI